MHELLLDKNIRLVYNGIVQNEKCDIITING